MDCTHFVAFPFVRFVASDFTNLLHTSCEFETKAEGRELGLNGSLLQQLYDFPGTESLKEKTRYLISDMSATWVWMAGFSPDPRSLLRFFAR